MFPAVRNSKQGSPKANEACVIKDQNLKAMQRGEMGVILIPFTGGSLQGLTQQGMGLKSHLIGLRGKALALLQAAEHVSQL